MTEYEKAMLSETRKTRKALQSIAKSMSSMGDIHDCLDDIQQHLR